MERDDDVLNTVSGGTGGVVHWINQAIEENIMEKEMKKKIPFVLSEDDLEGVSGGAALTGQTVGFGTTCEHFVCCFCGCGKSDPQETKHTCAPNGGDSVDSVCAYCVYNQGSMHAGACTYGL